MCVEKSEEGSLGVTPFLALVGNLPFKVREIVKELALGIRSFETKRGFGERAVVSLPEGNQRHVILRVLEEIRFRMRVDETRER